MYLDNHPIFYNDSQILRVDCATQAAQGLSSVGDIVQRIQDYPCSSSSWHGGLTYFINNCHFTFNEFKPIVDSIADRFLECKDHILNVLHSKNNYHSYLDFSNNQKNSDNGIGIDGISYAVGKIRNVLQEFYNNSQNITDIFINVANNGVMINTTKQLLNNCKSMVAEYVNVPSGITDWDITDNYFDIRGNSSGVYRIECSFDTIDNNEALASSLAVSGESMNILPVVGVGICVAIGVVATYSYNKYNNYNQNTIEDIECTGEGIELQEILS